MKYHCSLVTFRKTFCTLVLIRAMYPAPCPPPCSRPSTQCPHTRIPKFGGQPQAPALGNQTLARLQRAKLGAAVQNRDLQRCPQAALQPSCGAGSCGRPCSQPHGIGGTRRGLPDGNLLPPPTNKKYPK